MAEFETAAVEWRRPPRWPFKRILRWSLLVVGIAVLVSVGGLAGIIWGGEPLPDIGALAKYQPNLVTAIYSQYGELVEEFHGGERRYRVTLAKGAKSNPRAGVFVPPKLLVDAVVAMEDHQFYKHPGVNVRAILRALWADIRTRSFAQGGSTITQQLAGNLFTGRRKNITRKIKEAYLALQIDYHYSKEEILEMYLNQIFLGHRVYGVEAAARFYFGKHADQLTLSECAMIAGLPRRPNAYSPRRNPKQALQRRNVVLNRIADLGIITEEEAEEAKQEPMVLGEFKEQSNGAPYFAEYVRRQLIGELGFDEKVIAKGRLDVYTTLDMRMQELAAKCLRKHLRRVEAYERVMVVNSAGRYSKAKFRKGAVNYAKVNGREGEMVAATIGSRPGQLDISGGTPYLDPDKVLKKGNYARVRITEIRPDGSLGLEFAEEPHVQGAVVILELKTGAIRALVGGYDFFDRRNNGQFIRAVQAYRQTGSAFKPLIYAAAIETGLPLNHLLSDKEMTFTFAGKDWTIKNYHDQYFGSVSLRYALAKSLNAASVLLLKELGLPKALKYVHKSGIRSIPGVRDVRPELNLVLGRTDCTLLEMTAIFAAFGNRGVLAEPYAILDVLDKSKRRLYGNHQKKQRIVIREQTAYLITDVLTDVLDTDYGTGRTLPGITLPIEVAGKTGTTDDCTDSWFIGYSPELVVAVWMGHDKKVSLGPEMTGASGAGQAWVEIMNGALEIQAERFVAEDRTQETEFHMPAGIRRVDVCRVTGRRWVEYCGEDNRLSELFTDETAPTENCNERLHRLNHRGLRFRREGR